MLNQLAIAEVGNPMLGNIIVVSGSFVILMFLLKHFAWGPISDILKKREDKIANDLDSAEQSRIKAAKMEQEREQQLLASRSDAADIIKNAKESGELSRQNILKDTQEEVARLKSKAQADITLERDSALNSVKDDVADLSLQIAAKILNKELSPEMHESLINQYIEGLGSSNETR
ncbi:ATP synthase F0 subunit B [Enterococcus villorum]|jgi:F-type H+-transporting ATPase subunit b|uniref:ATP synthase subunit b n=2 Tax=Enterococcus villorum TaxID=112904 RepID=A0A1V8YWG0_9ENTE|nr:F0F1 ATP synthase subunit B [Enterococcus villorum]EOH85794.1 ATP synthase subunit B [Enterococcus villorum ATCC 700913]EOW78627.1 ATP synthase subunit B [Enterococcus villorum ATCC 700913]OQO70244.1 ATP synthase F0 subunit B [Enterococcus villorum]OQO76973.1 ATP synthase F0 subunit B [Enterococcus villorum]GEL92191.1 ATP synthase subunit b [Enterococcus villorum]